jgi:glutamyl-Q tRNA(Asp) synthetase
VALVVVAATATVGRFAPSPTGPLHLGSLVAAVGSWLFARSVGGRWLVRLEDLDAQRVVPGSAAEILAALGRYGLAWDGEPVWQSQRSELYEAAVARLRAAGLLYDCACSRAELRRLASAPAPGDPGEGGEPVYPGICRGGIPTGRQPRASRFRSPAGVVRFVDRIHGEVAQDVAREVGDFVVRRADGPFAYQLAVVVDDAEQGVTEVVRGADLLASTARQIALQRALGLPTPAYAHLPLVLGARGDKLGKRDGALPLPTLDAARVLASLRLALGLLGVEECQGATPQAMLAAALARFEPAATPRGPVVVAGNDEEVQAADDAPRQDVDAKR